DLIVTGVQTCALPIWLRAERLTSLLQDRDDPNRAAYKVMWRDLYGPDHPYGHMVIGTEPGLKGATRADLETLHQSVFRPDDAARSEERRVGKEGRSRG